LPFHLSVAFLFTVKKSKKTSQYLTRLFPCISSELNEKKNTIKVKLEHQAIFHASTQCTNIIYEEKKKKRSGGKEEKKGKIKKNDQNAIFASFK
jgi:hypothetical protein